MILTGKTKPVVDSNRPYQITVKTSEFIDTCHQLQKQGAIIRSVEVKANNSGYVLFLSWPQTK